MGTSSSAIRSQSGVQIGFALAISGYEYLLCDALDTAAIVTAWAGTGWTQALPGLRVRGRIRQEIQPWADSLNVPGLAFAIQPDSTDRFAIDVWKSKPTYRARLAQ